MRVCWSEWKHDDGDERTCCSKGARVCVSVAECAGESSMPSTFEEINLLARFQHSPVSVPTFLTC